ncbi:hypothetical protein OQA88_6119 [Cercophora sp. LCS_1]
MGSNGEAPVQIQTGLWINWSRGPVYGATITLTRSDANTLIAFIAFFVAWVGTCIWRIICFALHYALSSKGEQDGLHRQQQAILRNASEPEAGLRLIAMVFWAWRRRARNAFWRLLLPFLIALACVVIGTLASVFSSRITDIGSEVLIGGDNCTAIGTYVDFADKESDPYEAYLVPVSMQRSFQIETAANYALQCYSDNGTTELGCDYFVQRRLPIKMDMNAGCPFNSSLCKSQDQNLILDTGYLDSHVHFGINSAPKDRFLYRRVLHCAPLVTEGHRFATRDQYGNPATAYVYEDQPMRSNYTFVWGNTSTYSHPDYNIHVVPAFYENGRLNRLSLMNPSLELSQGRNDSEILLFFLSSNALDFNTKTEDPWYNAVRARNVSTFLTDSSTNTTVVQNYTLYQQSEPASPLGCRLQDQYCNPNKPLDVGCSPLGTIFDPIMRAMKPFDEDVEGLLARVGWFTYVIGDMVAFHHVPNVLGSHALLSRRRITSDGVQGNLPNNQWMLDMQYWLQINLASMQEAAIIIATGPSSPGQAPLFTVKPKRAAERAMCRSQKINSKDHASFSLVGIVIVFSAGLLFVVISYSLDPLMACLQRRRGVAEYRRLEWSTNGFLQLQRLGYETVGQGTWSNADGDVPVTKRGEVLAQLDTRDPRFPRVGRFAEESVQDQISLLTDKASSGYRDRIIEHK